MSSKRQSFRLAPYEVKEMYQCPANKAASLSVALIRPSRATIFVQQDALPESFLLTSAQEYINEGTGNVYAGDIPLGMYLDGGEHLKLRVASSTHSDNTGNLVHTGFRYAAAPTANPGEVFTTLVPTNHSDSRLKSLPILDFRADPLQSNVTFRYDGAATQQRFYRGADSQAQAEVIVAGVSQFNTTQGTYFDAGGAAYGATGLCVDINGNSSWWYNNINTTDRAQSAGYTSQPGVNSCYDIATTSSRNIVVGSPQIFFVGTTPWFWCSSWHSTTTPMAAAIPWSSVVGGGYTSWTTKAITFAGSDVGEKLFWCRYTESPARFFSGSSTGALYVSTSFGGTYTKVDDLPGDVNIRVPPVRVSPNQIAFYKTSGEGYKLLTVTDGPVYTWTDVLFYAEEPLLSPVISGAGIAPVFSEPTGSRPMDQRLYTATHTYDVVVPFDNRDEAADLVQNLSRSAERTNIVLQGGDRLFVAVENDTTIAHVYGYEE